ncbi:MAG: hypothetical protein ICV66_10755, partial [Chitinophagaceae bacterium]|nr:hypothetical protein [Chitinophagaceae bacterium]
MKTILLAIGLFVFMKSVTAQEGDTLNKRPPSSVTQQVTGKVPLNPAANNYVKPVKKDDTEKMFPISVASISENGEVLNYVGVPVKCVQANGFYLEYENVFGNDRD